MIFDFVAPINLYLNIFRITCTLLLFMSNWKPQSLFQVSFKMAQYQHICFLHLFCRSYCTTLTTGILVSALGSPLKNLSPLTSFCCSTCITANLAQVVWKVDNAMHQINHYPVDSRVCCVKTYPLDRDLCGGERYPAFEQLEPVLQL